MRNKLEVSLESLTRGIENAISRLDDRPIIIGDHDANYLNTYPVFVDWFASNDKWEDSSVLLGASLVYSWMPTTLKSVRDCAAIAGLLNQFGQQSSLESTLAFLNSIDHFVNRSWVGTSKFLHFFRPITFPIIDSRIAASLGLPKTRFSKNRDIYQAYLAAIHAVDKTKREEANTWALRNALIPRDHKNHVRTIELSLFYSGRS